MSFTAPTIPENMRAEACKRLGRIEATHGVTILFAIESGSRAWGFPSPDSDNDVRFFYVRKPAAYLGLTPPKDVIETPIEGDWDVNGWDLGKALRLLVGGNATVAEWLSSPLIYTEVGDVPYKLRDLIKRHSNAKSAARHYYGLGSRCYMSEIACRPTAEQATVAGFAIKGPVEVNYKKYLYALRAACCLAWIDRYVEIPPMTLPALLAQNIVPADVRAEIERLLKMKSTMGEDMSGYRIAVLDDWIEKQLAWAKARHFDKVEVSDEFVAEANAILLHAYGISF